MYELRDRCRGLAGEVVAQCDGPSDADDLPFRLVESVINRRSDDTDCPADQPWIIADGALRTLGFDGDLEYCTNRPPSDWAGTRSRSRLEAVLLGRERAAGHLVRVLRCGAL